MRTNSLESSRPTRHIDSRSRTRSRRGSGRPDSSEVSDLEQARSGSEGRILTQPRAPSPTASRSSLSLGPLGRGTATVADAANVKPHEIYPPPSPLAGEEPGVRGRVGRGAEVSPFLQ